MRRWLLRLLRGVPVEQLIEEREGWRRKRDGLRQSAEEAHRSAQRARSLADGARKRLDEYKPTVAQRIREGRPVACPECGSLELREVYSKPGKAMLRCDHREDHKSTWVDGMLVHHAQKVRSAIQEQEQEPRRRMYARLRDAEERLHAGVEE